MMTARKKWLPFKAVRNLCFGFLIAVNLLGGMFFYQRLHDVTETMYTPILTQRPYLNEIIELQLTTSDLDLLLHKQLRGDLLDNEESISQIDKLIAETTILKNKNVISEDESSHFDSFIKSLMRLKLALIYYQENRIYDSSSSSTEELYDIVDENIYNINREIDSILTVVNQNISEADSKFLKGTRYVKEGLSFFIFLTLTVTIFFILFLHKILSDNLNNLVNGTIQLGKGDFEWRGDYTFDDEFGKLNRAFNLMAEKINISQKKIMAQTEEIMSLAYHDSLTKLPNRMAFLEKLDQELARAARHNEGLGVLYIDLDDFKLINDSFGHDVGDILLREVAERLTQTARRSDTIARLSGDEFAVIVPHLNFSADVTSAGVSPIGEVSYPGKLSQRIIDDIAQPLTISSSTHYLSSSIGVALYPQNGTSPYEILKNADTAMYAAKREGKNRFKYCTEEMTAQMVELIEVERDLRKALDQQEFVLVFQPQVDLATNAIIGLEALIRWCHPERGMVEPDSFIPIAENRGLVQDISKWVIEAVFAQLESWQDAGHRLLPVMVNLSARDFLLKGIDNYLFDLVARHEQFRGLFGVEVTETAIMEDLDTAVALLQRLKEMGVRIALDDFGSGYSSMNYLQYFPVDTVKIDRSFIRNITSNRKNAAITEAIIAMSHALDFKVMAEGIETREQFEFLHSIRCDHAQGYFFHKPMLPDEVGRLLSCDLMQTSSSGV